MWQILKGKEKLLMQEQLKPEPTCKLWKAEMSQGLSIIQRREKTPEGDRRSQGLNLLPLPMILKELKQYLQIHSPHIRKGVWCSRTLAELTGQQIPRHSADYTDDFPSR